MPLSARTAANRENAKRSTGPHSAEGKAKTARNAVRHGLVGGFCILAHEDASEFQELLSQYRAEFKPRSSDENFMVEQMAQSRWTLARARRIESHLCNYLAGSDFPDGDPDALIAARLEAQSEGAFSIVQRYATSAERSYFRARRELQLARSQELRNKANEAKEWLKEKLHGPSAAAPKAQRDSHAGAETAVHPDGPPESSRFDQARGDLKMQDNAAAG